MEQIQRPYDRRHLKQVLHSNEALNFLLGAWAWVRAHIEVVLAAVLLLAAGAVGTYFIVHGRAQKAREASRMLSQAQEGLTGGLGMPPAQGAQALVAAQERFRQLANTYASSPAARPALLGQAAAERALGQAAQAEADYAKVDSGRKDDALGALAALGRAKALETQGKVPEAILAYARVEQVYPGSLALAEARAAREALGPAAPEKKAGEAAAEGKKPAGKKQ